MVGTIDMPIDRKSVAALRTIRAIWWYESLKEVLTDYVRANNAAQSQSDNSAAEGTRNNKLR